MMWTLLAVLVAQQGVEGSPPPVVANKGVEIYSDAKRNVSIRFLETPLGTVLVSSRLPAGWAFEVSIDGDQNGVWGKGPGNPDLSAETSPDRKYGQDSRNGVFCSQYVFSSFQNDPTAIYVSSECGGLKSDGRVIMTGFDSNMRSNITLEIPAEEFFRESQSALVQACVWDTARMSCQHRLPALLELKRTMKD